MVLIAKLIAGIATSNISNIAIFSVKDVVKPTILANSGDMNYHPLGNWYLKPSWLAKAGARDGFIKGIVFEKNNCVDA